MPTDPRTTTSTPPAATPGSAAPGSATSGHLSDRSRAILRAVAGGGAELSVGREPDLFLDGRCCSDQRAARVLVRAGLITTAGPLAGGRAGFGQRVAACLTPTGQHAMAHTAARRPAQVLAGGGLR